AQQDDAPALEAARPAGRRRMGVHQRRQVPLSRAGQRALSPPGAEPAGRGGEEPRRVPPDPTEGAVEIVSPGSVRRDYEEKAGFYAVAGIPLYLIFDPYRAVCVRMGSPEAGAYLRREERPYGGEVVLPSSLRSSLGGLTVDTARLPVDPG